MRRDEKIDTQRKRDELYDGAAEQSRRAGDSSSDPSSALLLCISFLSVVDLTLCCLYWN